MSPRVFDEVSAGFPYTLCGATVPLNISLLCVMLMVATDHFFVCVSTRLLIALAAKSFRMHPPPPNTNWGSGGFSVEPRARGASIPRRPKAMGSCCTFLQ